MDPITGAPDPSDLLRMMTAWLLGSPPGNAAGYVQGEMQSQQAVTDQARLDKVRGMVDASYPGVAQGTVQSSATPYLPAWRVTAEITPGPVQRMPRGEGMVFVRIRLGISNSPLNLNFTLDPTMSEQAFRTFIQTQYAAIAAAAAS
jgi:hypothetical protein